VTGDVSENYDLRESVKALGKLTPVLKDKFGNVIDGLHRLELYPDWPCITVSFIDTPEKLEAARLAVNTNRRLVSSSEIGMRVEFLAKAGLKVEQIMALTGLSKATIYRYIPQEAKDKTKVEAGQKGGQVLAAVYASSALTRDQTVKTPDTPRFAECERCHINTTEPKTWHGHTLCTRCEEKANFNPEAYDGYFRYLEHKTKPVMQPAFKDKWEHKAATMSPQHSKIEEKIVNKLRAKGYAVETDIPITVKEIVTIPDFNIVLGGKTIHGYVDGAVHNGKRKDKDEELRLLLKKRFPNDVIVSVDVKGDSDKEADEKVKEIEESLKW